MHTRGFLSVIFLVLFAITSYADDRDCNRGMMHSNDCSNRDDPVAEGGRLYDKWWAVYDLKKPTSTHPSYPKSGKQSGAATWRCKECHGWDYRGNQGTYKSGSHATGISGIRKYDAGTVDEVVNILKDERHGYDAVMLDRALKLIAEFVVRGQVDMDKYIDASTKKAKGTVTKGKKLYRDNCVECHANNGDAMNFGRDENKVEYIGTVASKNPWEAFHKLRNGHPGAVMDRERMHLAMDHDGVGHGMMGEEMPSMRSKLTLQQQVDLLSYMQSLPAK